MASENLIFISYSREDKDFAVKLARDLREKGVPIWLDQFDIKAGQQWDRAVHEALKTCGSMLVILSPASVASEDVQDEVAYAIKQNKTVIPVLYEECDIPYRLIRRQHVDLAGEYDRGFKHLIESLGTGVEAKRKAEEEKRMQAEVEDKRKAEEEERKLAEAEAIHKAEEEKRMQAEVEDKRKAEEKKRKQAEVEDKRKAEEKKRKQAEAEAAAIHRAEEEKRKQAEAEAKRKVEEKRKQAEAAAIHRAEEEKKELQKEKKRQRGQVIIGAVAVVVAAFIIYFVSKGISPDTTPEEFPGMASIPAGTFMMGSEDGDDDEKPVHKVYVDAFYMDSTEVTVEQYRKFLSETRRQQPNNWTEQLQKPKHPVVYVSWEDASAYAKWAMKRLPTEAEWEYAARSGLEGKKYPWGDEIDKSKANYGNPWSSDWSEGPGKYLRNVGSYAPNKYGLYDMAGNVWEWCADRYDANYYQNFKNATARNPEGPDTGEQRVMRGGSWPHGPPSSRCAYHVRDGPATRDNHGGFRCVQDTR